MSLAILFHSLCAQHVLDINISFIRCLRLFCWITTLVVSFLVRCLLEFRCVWVGVVAVLQAEACTTDTNPNQPHRNSNTHRTKNNTTNMVIQQNSSKLLMMDILMSETCWAHKKRNEIKEQVTSSWSFILQPFNRVFIQKESPFIKRKLYKKNACSKEPARRSCTEPLKYNHPLIYVQFLQLWYVISSSDVR